MTFKLLLLGVILAANTDPAWGEKKKVAVIIAPPFIYERDGGGDNVTYEGLIPDVLKDVTRRTGIEFTITPLGKGKFGEAANETWSKMTDVVTNQEAYVGAGPIPKTRSHPRGMHFASTLVEHKGWAILIRKPKFPAKNYLREALTLFRPFQASVWLSLLAVFIIVALLLTLNNLINPNEYRYLYKRDKLQKKDASHFGPFGSFLFAFSTLTWQGYEKAPRSNGARVLVMFWVAFVGVTLVAYVANLAAYLMTVGNKPAARLTPPVQGVHDLIANNIKYGTIGGWPTLKALASSGNNSVSELAQALENRGQHVSTVQEGINKVTNENYALVIDSVIADNIINSHCNIMSVATIPSDIKWYAFATKHQHHQDFESAVAEAKEDGTMRRIGNKWLQEETYCQPEPKTDVQGGVYFAPINIYQFVGPLCIVGAGIVLCIVVTLVEIFIYMLETRCFRKRDEVSMQALRDETHSDNIDGLHYGPAEQTEPAPAPRQPEHWVCSSVRQAPLAGGRNNASKDEMRRLHDNLQDIPDIDDI